MNRYVAMSLNLEGVHIILWLDENTFLFALLTIWLIKKSWIMNSYE